ncbi:spore coat protein [Bacillus sp. RG28]|uniref:Spore coat protein n=1 Tax=Gottfriedia endophytica TaxID=2820819 RepID=A0A940NND9_9BACI|nr:CotY/CotZ family spore coat protein [Gottfriedia endophytica]MBP0724613.1 spore coat protein [Gottfriedia endophytica]
MNGRERERERENREVRERENIRVRQNRERCVEDVIKFIEELQECATHVCPTGCDVPFLGANPNVPLANTRPFLLFLKNGELFRVPAFFNPQTMGQGAGAGAGGGQNANMNTEQCVDSVVFRVESVDDNCAVLRALVNNNQAGGKDGNKNQTVTFCEMVNGTNNQNNQNMFFASNTCVTVDLNFFAAIQCLRDTHVRNL